MILENWALVEHPDDRNINLYLPPDQQKRCVQGYCATYCSTVITSCIVKYDSATKLITTKSGNTYKLGKPNPEFVKWCQEQGVHVPTEDEPFECSITVKN